LPDPVDGDWQRDHVDVVGGRPLLERSVGSSTVVVLGELVEDDAEVVFAEQEHAVGAFASCGENEAFGVGIGPRVVRLYPRNKL